MFLFGRQDVNAGMVEYQKTPNAVLLDVREDDEFKSGHIPGALSIPLSRIDTITTPKDKPLYVYCLRGTRSKRAALALIDMCQRGDIVATQD